MNRRVVSHRARNNRVSAGLFFSLQNPDDWDEFDDLLQVERDFDSPDRRIYHTVVGKTSLEEKPPKEFEFPGDLSTPKTLPFAQGKTSQGTCVYWVKEEGFLIDPIGQLAFFLTNQEAGARYHQSKFCIFETFKKNLKQQQFGTKFGHFFMSQNDRLRI